MTRSSPTSEAPPTDARRAGDSTSRASRKEQQRRRILDSARTVFFRDGFMATNLDEVATGAGVAKGTLYRYFENKAELYVAVLSENGEIFFEKMRDTLDPSLSATDQVRRISRFYFQHWTHNQAYFQIFWALENESVIGELPDAVVTEVAKLWERCLRLLADVLERGIRRGEFVDHDAWESAHVLWTLANALIARERNPVARELRGRLLAPHFERAVEIWLRGLRRDLAGASDA